MGRSTAASQCTFHPDRETRRTCSRCGRGACPDCVVPVGDLRLCLDCLDRHLGTARMDAAGRPFDWSALEQEPPTRAGALDERLARPGVVLSLFVVAGLALYLGRAGRPRP